MGPANLIILLGTNYWLYHETQYNKQILLPITDFVKKLSSKSYRQKAIVKKLSSKSYRQKLSSKSYRQ